MTRHKNVTYEQAFNFALEVFQYDKDKTLGWWMAKRDEFNNMSPYEVVKSGKGRWLMDYLTRCIL